MLRHHNITLSLPVELINELHSSTKKRGISRFVEEAIITKLQTQKSLLEQQYIEAAQDGERNRAFTEWDQLSLDGLNEQNDW